MTPDPFDTKSRRRHVALALTAGFAMASALDESPEARLAAERDFEGLIGPTKQPRGVVDRVSDALLGRVAAGPLDARPVVLPKYRPWTRRNKRKADPAGAGRRAFDAAAVASAKAYLAGQSLVGNQHGEALRVIGGMIRGKNRRHRVYRMAVAIERREPPAHRPVGKVPRGVIVQSKYPRVGGGR